MTEFTPEIASDIVAACQASCEEAGAAFGRALDGEFSLTVGDLESPSGDNSPPIGKGPGLLVAFSIGESGGLILLPQAGELIPDWVASPDDSGKSKLATLAQELGITLLPEQLEVQQSWAGHVDDLASVFKQCEPADEFRSLSLTLSRDEASLVGSLVWPVKRPMSTLQEQTEQKPDHAANPSAQTNGANESGSADTHAKSPNKRITYTDVEDGISQLPSYARSLLRVSVPVTVTLASSRRSVDEILELAPGAIIQFDKSCDDNLTLEIGQHAIAEGEAVKVGDKFGLWITAMTTPSERFWAVNGKNGGQRVK
jgi:flagellar motor switch/type III secretory pathway protein FliN